MSISFFHSLPVPFSIATLPHPHLRSKPTTWLLPATVSVIRSIAMLTKRVYRFLFFLPLVSPPQSQPSRVPALTWEQSHITRQPQFRPLGQCDRYVYFRFTFPLLLPYDGVASTSHTSSYLLNPGADPPRSDPRRFFPGTISVYSCMSVVL